MLLPNLVSISLLLVPIHAGWRGDGECRGGNHGNRGGKGGGSGGNRGSGGGGSDSWVGNWADHGDDHGDNHWDDHWDGGHRDNNHSHANWRGGAHHFNLSMAEEEGIMGAPLVEQVRVLLTCLENGEGSLHSCRHEINETSACLECEEHAILRAVEAARNDRMEHEARGGDGKRGDGSDEGDDKPSLGDDKPSLVGLVVMAFAAALCGLLGFVCGKRAGRAEAQRLSVLYKGAAELTLPAVGPKADKDASDPEAGASRAFPATLVLEGKKVDTLCKVEHTPVEPIDGKMTA